MKFGREFKKQMVPEWTEAYMDYNGLKRVLREIQHFKQNNQPPTPMRALEQKLKMHRIFSGLTSRPNNFKSQGDIDSQVIDIDTMQQEGSIKLHNTKFLKSAEEGSEKEVMFFLKLDDELNKVNIFYKNKVEEALSEASTLDKQMDALIALRIKVQRPDFDGCSSIRSLFMDISSRTPKRITSPGRERTPGRELGDLTHGGTNHSCQEEEYTDPEVNSPDSSSVCREEVKGSNDKQNPLDILDHVKINNTLENPISTIKGVLMDSKERDLRFKKEELRDVEERLRLVFIEFYQKLYLLKHYSFMNLSAFAKIMKKYDKITSRNTARSYMKIVDNSYLGSSDEVTALLQKVEATFIKHFSNSNRQEGMKSLRLKQKKEKHGVTFISVFEAESWKQSLGNQGFFSGCSIALLVAIVLLVRSRKLMDRKEGTLHMENIFPLYSFYVYIVLHILLYAADIYLWRHYRINYPFIFGFKQGTELGYREVFLLGTGLAMLVLTTFLAHLYLKMDLHAKSYQKYTELVPLGLVTVILMITFCPLNMLYRSSRFFLIRCLFHCLCAPLYKVTFPYFFLADQLASQYQALRSFEFYICYYGLGEFSRGTNKCHTNDAYNVFYFIVAVVPYWIRFLQCLRRLFEHKDEIHGYNGLRYFLTIVAIVIRTAFELRKGRIWMVLAVVSSAVATVGNTYWDIVMDWGLLQRKSRNFGLREKLLVSHKSVYFAAMVIDIVLRFAWVQLLLKFNFRSLGGKAVLSTFSCLEIIRRGISNFFCLENEHLNNAGKYRAFKYMPLPFNYYDGDDDVEDDDDDDD